MQTDKQTGSHSNKRRSIIQDHPTLRSSKGLNSQGLHSHIITTNFLVQVRIYVLGVAAQEASVRLLIVYTSLKRKKCIELCHRELNASCPTVFFELTYASRRMVRFRLLSKWYP